MVHPMTARLRAQATIRSALVALAVVAAGSAPVPAEATYLPMSGFAPNGNYGAPLSVTTTSSETALPSGPVVKVSNVGAAGAYCALGTSSSVAATTADIYIAPNGGSVTLAVGSNTAIACITAAAFSTINTAAGTGLDATADGQVPTAGLATSANQSSQIAQETSTAANTATTATNTGTTATKTTAIAAAAGAASDTPGQETIVGYLEGLWTVFNTNAPATHTDTGTTIPNAIQETHAAAGSAPAKADGVQGVSGGTPLAVTCAACATAANQTNGAQLAGVLGANGTSIAAPTNPVPTSANNAIFVTMSVSLSASPYSAGYSFGGLLTLTGFAANTPYTVEYVHFTVTPAPSATTFVADMFDADPTSSTYTDNTAVTLAQADASKRVLFSNVNCIAAVSGETSYPYCNVYMTQTGTANPSVPISVRSDGSGNIYLALIADTSIGALTSGQLIVRAAFVR